MQAERRYNKEDWASAMLRYDESFQESRKRNEKNLQIAIGRVNKNNLDRISKSVVFQESMREYREKTVIFDELVQAFFKESEQYRKNSGRKIGRDVFIIVLLGAMFLLFQKNSMGNLVLQWISYPLLFAALIFVIDIGKKNVGRSRSRYRQEELLKKIGEIQKQLQVLVIQVQEVILTQNASRPEEKAKESY